MNECDENQYAEITRTEILDNLVVCNCIWGTDYKLDQ